MVFQSLLSPEDELMLGIQDTLSYLSFQEPLKFTECHAYRFLGKIVDLSKNNGEISSALIKDESEETLCPGVKLYFDQTFLGEKLCIGHVAYSFLSKGNAFHKIDYFCREISPEELKIGTKVYTRDSENYPIPLTEEETPKENITDDNENKIFEKYEEIIDETLSKSDSWSVIEEKSEKSESFSMNSDRNELPAEVDTKESVKLNCIHQQTLAACLNSYHQTLASCGSIENLLFGTNQNSASICIHQQTLAACLHSYLQFLAPFTANQFPGHSGLNSQLFTNLGTNSQLPTTSGTNCQLPTNSGTNSPLPMNLETNCQLLTNSRTNSQFPKNLGTNCQLPTTSGTNSPLPTNLGTNCQLPINLGTNSQLPTTSGTNSPHPMNLGTNIQFPPNVGTISQFPTYLGNRPQLPTNIGTNIHYPFNYVTNSQYPTNFGTNIQFPLNFGTNSQLPTNFQRPWILGTNPQHSTNLGKKF